MNQYFVKIYLGEFKLLAETLEDAQSEVSWDWANRGKLTIIERQYEYVGSVETMIDTDRHGLLIDPQTFEIRKAR